MRAVDFNSELNDSYMLRVMLLDCINTARALSLTWVSQFAFKSASASAFFAILVCFMHSSTNTFKTLSSLL